jgi:predicted PurR-regulated permease PerM
MLSSFLKNSPPWLRFLVIFPLLFLNGFLLFLLISLLKPLFNYLIISTLIAFLLRLLIRFLISKGIRKQLAIASVGIISLMAVVFLGVTVIPLMVTQLGDLTNDIPRWIEATSEHIEKITNLAIFNNLENLGIDINSVLGKISEAMNKALTTIGGRIFSLLQGTLNGVINTLLVIILTIFFLLGGEQFWAGIFSWLPSGYGVKIRSYSQEIFKDYFVVRFILAAISSVARAIIFVIFGIPYSILFAFGIGIASLIPFGGAVISILGTVIISLKSVGLGVKFLVSAIIIDQITDNVIAPKMMADKIGLNPIWILISIFIGAQLAGVLGLLLAVPVASLIKRIVDELKQGNNGNLMQLEGANSNPITDNSVMEID